MITRHFQLKSQLINSPANGFDRHLTQIYPKTRTFTTISLFFFFAIHVVNWSIQLSICQLPQLFSMLQAVMRADVDHCPCPTAQGWCRCAYNRVILKLDFLLSVCPGHPSSLMYYACHVTANALLYHFCSTFYLSLLPQTLSPVHHECRQFLDIRKIFCLFFFLPYSIFHFLVQIISYRLICNQF